jgi:hypothetical protein
VQLYNRRTVNIITPPDDPAVTLAEVKDMLVIDGTSDDNLLTAFIEAATDAARQYMRRSIVTETLQLRMDAFPGYSDEAAIALGPGLHTAHYPSLVTGGSMVDLPFGPVSVVNSITVWRRDNTTQTVDPATWTLGQDRVFLNESQVWPVDLRRLDAVAIEYVSGYTPANVPPAIKQGIKQHVLAMYECREGCEMPPACKAILAHYRRMDDLGWF